MKNLFTDDSGNDRDNMNQNPHSGKIVQPNHYLEEIQQKNDLILKQEREIKALKFLIEALHEQIGAQKQTISALLGELEFYGVSTKRLQKYSDRLLGQVRISEFSIPSIN